MIFFALIGKPMTKIDPASKCHFVIPGQSCGTGNLVSFFEGRLSIELSSHLLTLIMSDECCQSRDDLYVNKTPTKFGFFFSFRWCQASLFQLKPIGPHIDMFVPLSLSTSSPWLAAKGALRFNLLCFIIAHTGPPIHQSKCCS